jgi:hypothetical protein
MKNEIKIKMLGIGACYVKVGNRRIFIDAFNEYNTVTDLKADDIILFTHDDKDHFVSEEVVKQYRGNLIIGPPSIAYPLLCAGNIDSKQLKVAYPAQIGNPILFNLDDITISMIQSQHFMDWNPIHVSYLIEVDQKRIYITGDTHINHMNPKVYDKLDCLIYSLIKEEVVKSQMSSEVGVIYHMNEINDIQYRYQPKLILCNHVLNCDWAVKIEDMEDCLKRNKVQGVLVPHTEEVCI